MRTCTKTLNYAKLANIEQEKKEAPGKFLGILWEAIHRLTEIGPESEEGRVILNDRFLSQLPPDIHRKLLKQVSWQKQSSDNLLQLVGTVYYIREYGEKEKQRKTKEQTEALIMVVRTILRQPEKSAQRDPSGKGWIYYYCRKEGHLKWDCPQSSKLPPGPRLVYKGPHWKRDCPQRHRPQRSDSQDNQNWSCPWVPTQDPILIIPEEPWLLITVGG